MTQTKCLACGKGRLVWVEDILSESEGYVFVERGHRCTHCGEEFVPEEEGERTMRLNVAVCSRFRRYFVPRIKTFRAPDIPWTRISQRA